MLKNQDQLARVPGARGWDEHLHREVLPLVLHPHQQGGLERLELSVPLDEVCAGGLVAEEGARGWRQGLHQGCQRGELGIFVTFVANLSVL